MGRFSQRLSTAYLLLFFLVPQINGEDCSENQHPQCLFIAAVGLAGSTTLMDVLNQHPRIHLRGENLGLYNKIFDLVTDQIQWQTDYEQILYQGNWEKLQYFTTATHEQAFKGVAKMFKHFYGSGENSDKIVGFKEIRINSTDQIDLLRSLCKQTKFIFQYHTDIKAISNKLWYKYDPNAQNSMEQRIGMFHVYHGQHPNDTFISTINDFKKPDFVSNLFNFLGLSLEGISIDINRLYKASHSKVIEDSQTKKFKSQFDRERDATKYLYNKLSDSQKVMYNQKMKMYRRRGRRLTPQDYKKILAEVQHIEYTQLQQSIEQVMGNFTHYIQSPKIDDSLQQELQYEKLIQAQTEDIGQQVQNDTMQTIGYHNSIREQLNSDKQHAQNASNAFDAYTEQVGYETQDKGYGNANMDDTENRKVESLSQSSNTSIVLAADDYENDAGNATTHNSNLSRQDQQQQHQRQEHAPQSSANADDSQYVYVEISEQELFGVQSDVQSAN
eukprot:TRINITY_DN4693_c0_g1_i1.p1 TRINITY_DN4693_c0_g1~~TRINITY_DN4693_c0_g1_i1.p1  ORF type:complete len:500 (-),score=35.09 TRINITY_DN4693_c0_g1_i1:354-1853(-)